MTFMQFHIHSAVLQMGMDVWALLPDHPEKLQKPMKVLWLLHGGSGDQTAWLHNTRIQEYAGAYEDLAVILVNANQSCFVNMAEGPRYADYVGKELPDIMRRLLPCLSTKREDNWISGFSNGGYGCLHVGLRNLETFGAIGAYGAGDKADANFEGRMRDKERLFGKGNIKESEYCVRKALREVAAGDGLKPIIDHGCGEFDPWRDMNEMIRDMVQTFPDDPFQYHFTMVPGEGHNSNAMDALVKRFIKRMMDGEV